MRGYNGNRKTNKKTVVILALLPSILIALSGLDPLRIWSKEIKQVP